MMGMELNPRKCAMATTEGVPGLQLRLCPPPGKTMALGAGGGLRPLPGTPAATGGGVLPAAQTRPAPGGGAPLLPQHPRAAESGTGRHPGDPRGSDAMCRPLHRRPSDTARHLDHITVQVAKDRARYAFDASRDSLQDDRTLGLMRVPSQCQQAAVALAGRLVHQRSASVRAEVTRMFWEIAGTHNICPEVHWRVPEFATLAGGDWVHRIPRALAALGVGLYNPIACPRAAHVQLQSPPGSIVTLRTAKLQLRDTCRLMVPHTTPWHGHHARTTPSPTTTAVRECLNQCADEHLHYCRRKQEPTDHPGWHDALVHLFHTTGTRDPRLRLVLKRYPEPHGQVTAYNRSPVH